MFNDVGLTAQWAGVGTSIREYVEICLINNSPLMVWITKIDAFQETFTHKAFLYGVRVGAGAVIWLGWNERKKTGKN